MDANWLIPELESAEPPLFPPRVVCPIRPASEITLREYYGAAERQIQLHHEYPGQTFFVIADYRSLPAAADSPPCAAPPRVETLEAATIWLGLGLDPRKAVLYRESDVPQIMELACILAHYVRSQPSGSPAATMSSMDPFLMAGEILSVRGTLVATLRDNHSELARVCEMAARFNACHGEGVFPVPETCYPAIRPLHGTDEALTKELLEQITPFSTWGDIRTTVANALPDGGGEALAGSADVLYRFELRSGYEKWKKQPDAVEEILRNGGIRVREEAEATLDEIRSLIGVRSAFRRRRVC